jgi:anaerobic selenocysteine-containing dehydrogenase
MPTTHHTFCRICEALCGIEVTVDDGRITAIEPDPDHVATQGFGCVKGMRQHDLYDSPDRLTAPMRRVGDDYEPATWEEALADIGARVQAILATSHPDAIAMYVGTAAGFSVLHPMFAQGFMDGLGSASMYASATQDCANKFAVSTDVYGFPFTLTYPDVDRTQLLIVVGANPAVSKWSFLQVSNPVMRIREIQERGGRVVVVDPRRTETARRAEHLPIRPDTDVFFYLAFLNEVIARNGIDQALVERHTTGWDEVAALVQPWTPERCAAATGIPAGELRDLVAAYLDADGAALYCSTGVNMGTNGALAFWLQEVINAVTGNLDRPGGALVGTGIIDFPKVMTRAGRLTSDGPTSRIGGFRQVNGAWPGGILADEILTPGDRQVRALFVTGGNPLLTMANSGRLREAFESLDLLVTLDIFLNETGSVADWVLPTTAPFQRPDLPFLFPLLLGLQSRPYLQATRAVVDPEGLQRDEASIYVDLARACGVPIFGSRVAQRLLQAALDRDARRHPGHPGSVPQERLLDLLLRASRNGSFNRLADEPHGRPLPVVDGDDFLGKRLLTDDGRMHLAPANLLVGAQRLESVYDRLVDDADRFRLITMRHVKTHNSWTHNAESFITERFSTNHVHLHPDDAAALGLDEEDIADVSSDVATIRLPVRFNADLMRGVIAVPHGWGHQHAKGLSVASRTSGVNVNLLAADGPDGIDDLSGMVHLTGLPVVVAPAAGPQDPATWSGLPA